MEPGGDSERSSVRLYTDGACKGNPGPGGWAYILEQPSTGRRAKLAGAVVETTNNRMELQAVIEGLSALKRPCKVELVTDSQYVAKGITEWLRGWKARNWQRMDRGHPKPVMNVDLWKQLDGLLAKHHVKVKHVLGHRGHAENEECDRMAVEACKDLIRNGTA